MVTVIRRKTLRHVLTAGLLALGFMSGLLAAGTLLPPWLRVAALYPGMLVAEGFISLLPEAANAWLAGGGDDGPAVFAALSVGAAFLFWWACALGGQTPGRLLGAAVAVVWGGSGRAAAEQRHAPDRRHAACHLLSELRGGG
jgi:hypothetical protein